VREVAIRLDDDRRREFRRFLAGSAALHVVLFAVLAFGPGLPVVTPTSAIPVRLVTAPGRARPAPSRPRPRPKPPKPVPTVLPKETSVPKPQAKPEPPEEPVPAPEEPVEEEAYVDVMAQLRAELGEEAPEIAEAPEATVPSAPLAAGAAIGGRYVSPEWMAWEKAARIHLKKNWVMPPAFRMQSLVTVVEIDFAASGQVLSDRVVESSRNPWYDDGALRSIRKASPFPAPPGSGPVTFLLSSDDF
jgi:TonB family protein